MTHDEAIAVSTRWMRKLMAACSIEVVSWPDGSTGLVDVPAKYCAAIDAMHRALMAVMTGEGLPEIIDPAPKWRGRRAP